MTMQTCGGGGGGGEQKKTKSEDWRCRRVRMECTHRHRTVALHLLSIFADSKTFSRAMAFWLWGPASCVDVLYTKRGYIPWLCGMYSGSPPARRGCVSLGVSASHSSWGCDGWVIAVRAKETHQHCSAVLNPAGRTRQSSEGSLGKWVRRIHLNWLCMVRKGCTVHTSPKLEGKCIFNLGN